MKREERNKRGLRTITFLSVICYLLSVISSCDYGKLGGADKTDTYYAANAVYKERMNFLDGVWHSRYAGIGRLDSYRICKWGDFSAADKAKAQAIFPALNINNPRTYSLQDVPQNGDYILLYNDTIYGQQEGDTGGGESGGFSFMGMVRAINIFNNDKNRGAIIIEYFEGADPAWLSDTQGLTPGEKPFFGVYYRALSRNVVQMANAVDLAALYAGNRCCTEKETLDKAIKANSVENEAEFITWGVVSPQDREQ